MLRAIGLATFFVLLPVGAALAGANAKPGANAALQYWRAFATMPTIAESEQRQLIADFPTMPLDAQARERVSRAEYALQLMHQGAALRGCDWAVDWDAEGIDALLPYLSAARVLTSLACLRARIHFQEGRAEQGVDDLVAAITVGRHVSQDGSLIAILVAYNIEGRMSEMLALSLPRLDAQRIRALKARLDALPAAGTAATGLRVAEENSVAWFIRQVRQAKDRATLLALLGRLSPARPTDKSVTEKGQAFLDECGGSADGVVRFAKGAQPSYVLMATKLALPMEAFATELERERHKQAGNPVFRAFFPAMDKIRLSQARAEVRRALLAAALAVQVDGPGALKTHPDPMVGGAFDYAPFEGGFELRSKGGIDDSLRVKWKLDEGAVKPLVLTVGQRKK